MKNILRLVKLILNQRTPREDNQTLTILYNRKSCRKFLSKEVTEEQIEKVLEAGCRAPSTVNLQTWSFFPFLSKQWKDKFGVPIPFGAQAAIIVAADLNRLKIIDPIFKEYPIIFYSLSIMNTSLAAMNMAIAVEALGMKSIMLSQTGKTGLIDYEYLKEKLKLPDLVFPLTTLAFGYPASDILFSPPKLNKEAVIHRNGEYKIKESEVKEWFQQMELACNIVEKERLVEKFQNYLKMLPKAEKELFNAFKKINL